MSNTVLPLPSGFGVAVITEHRSNRQPAPRPPNEEEPRSGHGNADGGDGHASHDHQPAPPPPADEPGVDAETLFATTLFANQMPLASAIPPAAGPRNGQEWVPPESPLHLRDKLI